MFRSTAPYWLTVSVCLLLVPPAACGASETAPPIRLRLEWGNTHSERWSGLLEITEGHFEDPVSLGIEADEPGTIWIDRGAVWFQRKTASVYDGFDVTVVAPPQARLIMTLQSCTQQSVQQQLEVAVADLYGKTHVEPLDSLGTRLVIRRTPGDSLVFRTERPHLVFGSGEQFTGTVALNVRAAQSERRTGRLHWQLTEARSDNVLSEGTRAVTFRTNAEDPIEVATEFDLPESEGVYDIRYRLAATGMREMHSSVQVVVLSHEPSLDAGYAEGSGEKLVDSFVPRDAGLFRKVRPSATLKIFDRPLNKIRDAIPSLLDWRRSSEMGVGVGPGSVNPQDPAEFKRPGNIQWSAFRLKADNPGQPHRLVIHAPADSLQSVGVSLLEPNAAGQLMPVGLDTGLLLPSADGLAESDRAATGSGAGNDKRIIQHCVTFWPRIREPILLLHNFGSRHAIDVRQVELYEIGHMQTRPASGKPAHPAGRRLVGPYMHKPMLPENFGATEAYDRPSRRSLDDWQTFHTAALRLVDYLHAHGNNSLMLAVLADGSTIYPSRLLQPTPRYDTGMFFSTGQDPIRKDVVELLYRLFDREGLILIPELQFSTPLPALEKVLTSDGEGATGIELIARDGRSWRETKASYRGLAPYYNPLNPRVQQAVLEVVEELAGRYRSHESFGGVAIELSSVGYLQLPGLKWGYDDGTIARFEKDTGLRIPSDGQPDAAPLDRFRRRYEFLTGQVREEWIRWRCQELARFHQRLSETVTQATPKAQFFLSCNRVLRGSHPDDNLLAALKSGAKIDELLAPKGLDFQLYAEAERFVVLRPSLWAVPEHPLDATLDETLNSSPVLDAAFAGPGRGSLLYHLPRECRIPEFDAISPWQPAFTWLAVQPSPTGQTYKRQYAHALAALDATAVFDGGWMIPFGQEKQTAQIRDVICAIPAIPFYLCRLQEQPAVVRVASDREKTYICVVNDSAAPIDVGLDLSCPAATPAHLLGRGGELKLERRSPDRGAIPLQLGPYGVWACELGAAAVRVEDVHTRFSSAGLAAIDQRIEEFGQRMTLLQNDEQVKQTPLENPGFEAAPSGRGNWSGRQLPGWTVPATSAAYWTVDRNHPRAGKSALMLASNDRNVAVLSSELPVEDNRFLTMSVWLRSDRPAARVKLAFEASVDGEPNVQAADVQVDAQWRRYVFRVNEIPPDRLEEARVRVEMLGPGRLWIDDVDVQMHRLTPADARQLTKVFAAISLAREEKRYADCQRMLDSYWGRLLFDNETAVKRPVMAARPKRPSLLPKFLRR